MTRIIGLTGSIGMGKSATAAMFRAAGVLVHDADETVHRLYSGQAAPLVDAVFPGVVRDGAVDRVLLSERVLGDAKALRQLESIVHPLVRADRNGFVAQAESRAIPLVVLDVPLLFETGSEKECDVLVVVTAPSDIQRARVLSRTGMTEQRFSAILAKQLPDAEKRRKAHFVVDSGRGFAAAERDVRNILRCLAGR